MTLQQSIYIKNIQLFIRYFYSYPQEFSFLCLHYADTNANERVEVTTSPNSQKSIYLDYCTVTSAEPFDNVFCILAENTKIIELWIN